MRDLSLAETLFAKEAMEKVMAQAGRTFTQYHADNGRFAENDFVDAVNTKSQKLTFCGVGAHHQNGIIENKNKILTTGARTLLLHGIRMWLQMIDDMFWPFVMSLWGATTFVDHVSDYVYVHLMRDLSLAETLLAK